MNLTSANLSSAILSAKSSLASNSQQISTLSRNISGIGDANYVRRDAQVHTGALGTTRVETQRYVNQAVYSSTIHANGNAAKAGVIATGIDRISSFQDSDNFTFSSAKLMEDLQRLTEFAASAPSDNSTLAALVEKGHSVASSINASYSELLSMRTEADKQVANSVTTINQILNNLTEINNKIVIGTRTGADVYDSMDTRDRMIKALSEEIGVKVLPADDNGIVLTTNSGAMLFEGEARSVTFDPTVTYGATTVGGELRVDGVVVSGPNANMPLRSGRIAGNLELRDNVLVDQLQQLDEISRGLIDLFAEEDQTGGGKPKLAGLFTWSGGPAVPASATLTPGIAASLQVNTLVDPQAGGDVTLIRDGVINGDADYSYNTTGAASFSDRLYALAEGFDVPSAFDAAAGLPSTSSLNQYAKASLDQLNSKRSTAMDNSEYQAQLSLQFTQTLQNESGVNLDFEMSRLLEVERAYQASARILNVVDQLMGTLLEATR